MRYLLETTRGYRLRFSCLFFTIIFATVTGGMFPYAIGKIVDQIFYQKQLRGFLGCFFLYAGFYFLNQCGHMALNYLWAHLKVSYVTDIRKQCFEHLLRLKAGILAQVRSGDVMKRIQDDTECFLEFIHRSLFYVLANFVQLGISVGYTIYTNFFLGLTVIVMTPVMAYSIRYFSRKLTERHERIRDKMGLADAWIQEVMVGLTEIRLLGALPKAGEDYEGKTRDVIREEIGAGYLGLEADSVNEMLTLAGQLCIYCIAAFSVCRGTMTVGQFVACAAYFSSCAAYFNALGKKLTDISANMVGIRRVEEFLSWEVEQDSLSAEDRCIREGGISFADVSFGYAEAMVLKQISLEVHPGDRVAFVGKSGEGKSTLLQLIYRFYEPQEGKILIDGAELADYTLESLRNQIGVVQQDNGLFRGSLRELELAAVERFDFTCLEGIGDIMSSNIHEWFRNSDNLLLWRGLQKELQFENGWDAKASGEENTMEATNSRFAGCTIVATGTLENFTREGINAKIFSLGATPGSSVTKKTDYLICGQKAGSKLAKAQKLGIPVLTEQEFMDMIAS